MNVKEDENQIPSEEAAIHLNSLYDGLGDQEQDFRNGNLIKLVGSLVEGENVLDIGCGAGRLLSHLKSRGLAPVGIEPDDDLRALGQRLNPDLEIVAGDGKETAAFRESFDTITIIDVLEHIEDDRAQIEMMWNALKPGGRLIVVVPAHQWLYGKRDKNIGHFRRYSRKMLVSRVQEAGFEVESSRFWNVLGVGPYWFSEKVLRKELNTSLRNQKQKNVFKRTLASGLRWWFRNIENNISFGLGLSVMCIARKPESAAVELRKAA